MAELLKQSKQYRVDTDEEIEELITEAKEISNGIVDFSRKHKTKKQKGEVVDEWWIVDITEKFVE